MEIGRTVKAEDPEQMKSGLNEKWLPQKVMMEQTKITAAHL